MVNQIFVNLAVKDLPRSMTFFSKLGFTFEPKFTNDKGACMVIAENMFVMLLVEDFFQTFTDRALCDPKRQTEALICLACTSRSEVDQLVGNAIAAGGSAPRPVQDSEAMYGHGFEDLDGHIWELVYMP